MSRRGGPARQLFLQPCTRAFGVSEAGSLPRDGRPEVCFAGRSNVGKSSLLNALVGRRALARTSSTPGRTRQLDFYDLGGVIWLVDLPGYGYARVSKRESAAWMRLVEFYLAGRRALRRAYVLLDARRGPGPTDRTLMEGLDTAGVSHRWVLTKTDKLSPTAPLPDLTEELARFTAAHPSPLVTSAVTRVGIDALRADIAECTG